MPDQNYTKQANKRQTSQYDKLLRENLEATLPVIIRDVLKLDILESEEIPDDIQHTRERKPDALKKITGSNGDIFILHVEFQLENETEMVYRMAEYNIMLMRRYKLPVKQYVIYLHASKPSMPAFLHTENLRFHYSLMCIADADYRMFLRSDNPEVKVLAILANLGQTDTQNAVNQIVNEVQTSTTDELLRSKYLKQIRIFVQLRNSIEQQFLKAMQSVSTFFKVEKDVFYRLGEERGEATGEARGKAAVVENLIKQLGLSDEKIAGLAEVSIEFVEEVRTAISK